LEIENSNINWDIICLTEIGIKEEETNNYQLCGYKSVWCTRETTSRGGGILLLIKQATRKIKFETKNVKIDLNDAIVADLNIDEIQLSVIIIYRQPSLIKKKFVKELNKLMTSLKKSDNVLIVGDINIDILYENNLGADNVLKDKYLNIMALNGFTAKIDSPTREEIYGDKITKSCIDHMFFKSKDINCNGACIEKKLADHYYTAVRLEVDLVESNEMEDKTKGRLDDKNIVKELDNLDWSCLDCYKDNPTEMYKEIKKIFNLLYEANKCNNGVTKKGKKPWVTPELLNLIINKDELWRKIKRKQKPSIEMLDEYRKIKNLVQIKLKRAKQKFFADILQQPSNNNNTNLWKQLNKILGKRKSASVDDVLQSSFQNTTIDELSNRTNKHFANIVPKLRKKNAPKKNSNNHKTKFALKNGVTSTILITHCSPYEITEIVKEMKIKSSTGYDGISMKHISESIDNSSIFLSKLINAIIDNEVWPDELKIQVQRPIYKNGSKKNLDNYRPISLLSNINKIIEKFFAKKILTFLNKHNVITEKQFGFRQSKGAVDALKYINEIVSNSLNNGKHVEAVLVDLQKAFDTVDHQALILKCEHYGLRGKCGNILKSYLLSRTACTRLGNCFSEFSEVLYGVPQGSILGPLLFTIYINDVIQSITHCEIVLFADDILLVSINDSKKDLHVNLQNDFDKLNDWFLDNDVFINETKTNLITISSPHRKFVPPNLFIHSELCKKSEAGCSKTCTRVETINEAKYLGLRIDYLWKHHSHIFYIINKLRQLMPTLYNLKPILNGKNKLIVYNALVLCHILYGIEIYGFAPEYLVDKLQRTHNKVIKLLFGSSRHYESTASLMKKHGILTIVKLRDYMIIKNNYFNNENKVKDNRKYNYLRDKTIRFNIPLVKNSYGAKCLNHYIPTVFNKLPTELLNLSNYGQVKKLVKKWLLSY
jgi:hypothetical protein